MRDIRRIFIHCTAGSQKQTLKQLLQEFKDRGWKNPGYHYVVFPNGEIEQLLPESEVSNGVQGYNSTSINIAYVGGIDNKGRAIDNRTEAQKDALRGLILSVITRYPNAHIMGHRDIWGKDKSKWKKQCPCFDAEAEYANIYHPDWMDKYEDATGCDENGNEVDTQAQPELYIYENKTDYTGLLNKYKPW